MRRVRSLWLTLSLTATAAGCAVLNIDVDVYKGLLANHPETQLRQFAAYAIGVKHLLVSMRNDFEWPDPQKRRALAPKVPFDFVRPHTDPTLKDIQEAKDGVPARYNFQNEQARLLNSVLSMYKDLGDEDARPYVAKLESTWSDFEQNKRKYDEDQGDGTLCRQFEARSTHRDDLYAAYRTFLKCGSLGKGAYRDARKTIAVCYASQAASGGVLDCGHADGKTSSNAAFLTLGDPKRVQTHFAYLVPGDPGLGQKLTARVTEISTSFTQSRANLETLWYLAIDAIWSAYSPAFYKHDDADDKKYQERVVRLIAPALATLTQPRNLACALEATEADTLDANALKRFRDSAYGDLFSRNTQWTPERYSAATRVIEAAVRARPAETVNLLRAAHERFKELPGSAVTCNVAEADLERMKTRVTRTFGIVRGNFDDDRLNFAASIEDLKVRFAAVEQAGAQGFETGRLSEGIETLTRDYLRALERKAADERGSRDRIRQTGTKLQDHLIGFAEKVRTVADHRATFERPQTGSADGTGAFSTSRQTAILRDVFLLQSLSNTLLSFSDELRFRSEHENRLQQRARSERSAQERAFAVSSYEAFETLRKELRERAARASAEAKSVGEEQARAEKSQPAAPDAARKKQLDDAAKAEGDRIKVLKGEAEPAAATYVLLSGKPAEKFEYMADTDSLAKLGEIRATVRAKVLTKNAAPTPAEFVKEITDVLTQEVGTYKATAESTGWPKALVQAKAYLETKENEPLKGTRAEMYSRIQAAAERKVASQRAEWTGIDSRLTATKRQLGEIAKVDKGAEDRAAAAKKRIKELTDESAEFEKAVTTITALREPLFKSLEAGGADIGYDEMVRALGRLLDERAKAQNGTSQADAKLAMSVLSKIGRAPSSAVRMRTPAPVREEDQKAALDNVLDVLNNELIAALREGNTPKADHLRNAIAAANQRRADMAFIRPSVAFLRNSNAATSLQSDPSVYWRNMLSEHGWRTLLPPSMTVTEHEREINAVRTEVDKQFWQTVNTVRVAGAGKTDYVIAKDDIGNWYVKAYDADPSSIIKSAQGLALFNLGGSLNMNLLRQTEINRELSDKNLDPARRQQLTEEQKTMQEGSKASVEPLSRVLDDYKRQYASTLQGDAVQLGTYTQTVPVDLKDVWRAAVPSISDTDLNRLSAVAESSAGTLLAEARKNLTKEEVEKQPPTRPVASRVQSALSDLRRYASAVEQAVASDAPLVQAASASAEEATTKLNSATRAVDLKNGEISALETDIRNQNALLDRLTDPTERDKQVKEVSKRMSQLEQLRTEQGTLAAALKEAERKNVEAQAALASARKNREALAKAARDSIIARSRSVAERRLSEIGRYEQAVIVVKGAASPPPAAKR